VFGFKVGPALAAGNTFVLKPPEKSPFSSLFMAKLIKEAGFPNGVFNLVLGEGMTGALLSAHMDIDMISFTGSVPTGRKISAAANSSNMKRVTLELGGKSPALVFEDANLAIATKWLSIGLTMNAGQVCVAPSRIYVAEAVAEELVIGIKKHYETIAADIGGDPLDPNTNFGPVIDKAQKDRICRFIEQGKTEATLITGGNCYNGPGHYVFPTIFLNPAKDASIIKEEIFGPVLTITTFKSEEEALSLANDTEFGLAGLSEVQDT
jgi:aldehyde dehydrogenase (NAD+)